MKNTDQVALRITGWTHVADAAVAGLWLAVHPLDASDVEQGHEGCEDEQPEDDCLDKFEVVRKRDGRHGLGRLGGGGVGCTCLDHFFESDCAPREIAYREHVLRRYAVINYLADSTAGYAQVKGKRLVASALFIKPWFEFHGSTLEQPKATVKLFLKMNPYDLLKMDALTLHRKKRLQALVKAEPFDGNQLALANAVGLSESRISQMATEAEGKAYTFGERAARSLAVKLDLDDRYFEEGFNERAKTPAAEQPTEKLIGHSDENNTASSLLLRLTEILGSLSPGLQDAAISVIAEAVKSPHLAPVHAVRLDGLLKPERRTSTVRPDVSSDASINEAMRRLRAIGKPIPSDEDDIANKQGKGA